MSFNKNLVIFQAHPDDTEIFASGTLALLSENDWSIHIVTLTSGQLGGIDMSVNETALKRRIEAKNSAQKINASYDYLSGEDGFLFDTSEIRIECLEIIRKYNAGVVLVHHPKDYHADHRISANIVETACMFSTLPNVGKQKPIKQTPLLYHTSTLRCLDQIGQYMEPDFFVDVRTVIDKKTEMINCHKSQKELMRVMHKMNDFLGEMLVQDKLWGQKSGFELAEAFYQHRGGGFDTKTVLQDELKEFVKNLK